MSGVLMKIFVNDCPHTLTERLNEYVEENNLSIVSTDMEVAKNTIGYSQHKYIVTLLYRENKEIKLVDNNIKLLN